MTGIVSTYQPWNSLSPTGNEVLGTRRRQRSLTINVTLTRKSLPGCSDLPAAMTIYPPLAATSVRSRLAWPIESP